MGFGIGVSWVGVFARLGPTATSSMQARSGFGLNTAHFGCEDEDPILHKCSVSFKNIAMQVWSRLMGTIGTFAWVMLPEPSGKNMAPSEESPAQVPLVRCRGSWMVPCCAWQRALGVALFVPGCCILASQFEVVRPRLLGLDAMLLQQWSTTLGTVKAQNYTSRLGHTVPS